MEVTTSSVAVEPLRSILPEIEYLTTEESYNRLAIAFKHEDLPDPDGPMMTFKTPGSNVVLMSSKMHFVTLGLKSRRPSTSNPKCSRLTLIPCSAPSTRPGCRPSDESGASLLCILAISTSVFWMCSMTPDKTKKKMIKPNSTTIGRHSQFEGRLSEARMYAPVYSLQTGSSNPSGLGQS